LLLVASASADSVTYQANPQHSGAVDDGPTPPLGIRWAWNLNGPASYPVVAGGKVYVAARDLTNQSYGTTLYTFDAQTGTLAWSRPLSGTYWFAALAYDAGRLFVLNFDGILSAFDANTGAALWGKQMPGQYAFTAPPTAYSGTVYVGGAGSGGTVYAVRETDGTVLWTGSVMNGDDSSPAVDSTGMYVNYACNQAYSFTLGGSLKWHHDSSCEGGGGATPVLYDGKVWIRDGGANLILDTATGSELGSFASGTPPVFAGGVGVFLQGGTLAGERMSDRVPLWSFQGDGELRREPLTSGGVVYALSESGNLFGLNRDSGSLVWSDCLPDSNHTTEYQSGPPGGMGAGGGLLVVPSGRYVVAYESRPGAASYICAGTQPATGPAQVAGTSGTPAPPAPQPSSGAVAGAQASSVTLSASKANIRFGQVVTLRGKAAPGAQVDLQSDAFPTDAFLPRKSTTVAADGSFSFRVRPDRNTAFKAVSGGVESAATIVYVDVGGSLRGRAASNGRWRLTSVVLGPRDLPYKRKRIYFYAISKSGKSASRLASRRLAGKNGTFTASVTTPVRVKHYAVCIRERKPDAWGRPLAVDKVCGARRLKL
jgi:outer membrane protein assembly factor BamB